GPVHLDGPFGPLVPVGPDDGDLVDVGVLYRLVVGEDHLGGRGVELLALGWARREQYAVRRRRKRRCDHRQQRDCEGGDECDETPHDFPAFLARMVAPTPRPNPRAPSTRPAPPSNRAVSSVASVLPAASSAFSDGWRFESPCVGPEP